MRRRSRVWGRGAEKVFVILQEVYLQAVAEGCYRYSHFLAYPGYDTPMSA